MSRKINEAGKALIKEFEGLRLKAYKCPAGVWTIAFGHTGDVKPGMRVTEHQAEVILDFDLAKFEEAVEEACAGLGENQFAACVSLVFNIGIARFLASTLRKKLCKGQLVAAADEFPRWTRARGIVLPGLVKRREAERQLFLKGGGIGLLS